MSGNLRKPEARVFEINSPTKKLEAVVILMSFLDSNTLFVDRNQRFEALIEMPSPTCYCVKLFLYLMQRFSVLLFVSSKQTRSLTRQMAEIKTDLDLPKLLKKKKSVMPALFRSLPAI